MRDDGDRQRLLEFDPKEHARTTDLETSHAAAASMEESAPNLCEEVHALLLAHPDGLTSDEVCDEVGDGAWKRISDLRRAGLARPSGRTRPGRSGRQQTVWLAVREEHAVVPVIPEVHSRDLHELDRYRPVVCNCANGPHIDHEREADGEWCLYQDVVKLLGRPS